MLSPDAPVSQSYFAVNASAEVLTPRAVASKAEVACRVQTRKSRDWWNEIMSWTKAEMPRGREGREGRGSGGGCKIIIKGDGGKMKMGIRPWIIACPPLTKH